VSVIDVDREAVIDEISLGVGATQRPAISTARTADCAERG
jgi:hypothetical protein